MAKSLNPSILWIKPIQHPRKRNGFADVLEAADPGDRALNAHTEATVRYAAEFAQVEVPLERFFRQAVLVNALQQQIVRCHALRAADNFSVAFGREHVDTKGKIRPLRIGLHVEGLHFGWITM